MFYASSKARYNKALGDTIMPLASRIAAMTALFVIPLCWGGEYTQKSYAEKEVAAKALHEAYVVPLRLPGTPAGAALDALLAHGFQCGIIPVNHIRGVRGRARLNCERNGSDQGDICPVFEASVVVAWRDPNAPRAGLLAQMADTSVEKTSGFCHLGDRNKGNLEPPSEKTEAEQFIQVGMNAKAAFEKLLIEDFRCGFERVGGSINIEQIDCSPLLPRQEACRLPRVRLVLEGAKKRQGSMLEGLESASVGALHVGCLNR